jgi:putative ABC transport system ATP-binding protein
MSIIELNNIQKHFLLGSSKIPVLNDIDLKIEEGEFIGVVGPSGSGKTTLLALIAGLLTPTNGTININGIKGIEKLSKEELASFRLNNLGFIFQSNRLISSLTAFENLEVPLILANVPVNKRKTIVEKLLDEVGLSEKGLHFPDELSGGEQQRIAVARALVNNPKIIIADEPTGNLDSMNGAEIFKLLKKLSRLKEKTILIVSHDPSYYEEFDKIFKIEKGQIVKYDLNI